MKLFDTHFVKFDQILVVSGMKVLISYKKLIHHCKTKLLL